MDKNKVLDAYFRGLLTKGECAQILGMNHSQVSEMIDWTEAESVAFHIEQA